MQTLESRQKDDDSFGSLPDIDFEEMDKMIAQRTSLSCSTSVSNTDPLSTPIPPNNLPIINMQATTEFDKTDRKYGFPAFSRYQVHNLKDEIASWTKILLVSQT